MLFSKSVLDIRTRLVVTVEPETKWMPTSDSASKLVPKCKRLGQYDLPNYFYSCLKLPFSEIFIWLLHIKMSLGEKVSPRFAFIWKVHIILEKSGDF